MEKQVLAVDTETHRFGPGNMAPPVVCLSWAMDDRSGVIARDGVVKFLRGALEQAVNGGVLVVAYNAAYDARCLMATFPELYGLLWRAYEAGAVECVQVREKLLDIATGDHHANKKRGYSLATVVKCRLNLDMEKDAWRMDYDKLDGVPVEQWPQGAHDYALLDAKVLLPLWHDQDHRARRIGYSLEDSIRQTRADLALGLTSAWGLRTDGDRVAALHDRLQTRMQELRIELRRDGLMRHDGTKSMEAVRAHIVACLGIDAAPRTQTGLVATGADVIEMCDDPVLELQVEFSQLEKMGSTYVRRMFDGIDGPIHASYDCLGADSGRTSGYNPNLQNQPRLPGVRECYRSRDGHVFVACDYDSQELRTLAEACVVICGKSVLAERYQADPGFDPHVLFASQRMGISYEKGMRRKKSGEAEFKEFRRRAKAANFGFPGGLGARSFRIYAKNNYGVKLTEQESVEEKKQWFAQWPEMDLYFRHAKQVVANGGVGTIQHLYSKRWRGMAAFTQVANNYFSGLAADTSKDAFWEVAKRCYAVPSSALYGCRPVVFVHDEIVIEAPADRAHEAALELKDVMEAVMNKWTPHVPARASPSLMRHWSKDAKQVCDGSGRLIPWEDAHAAGV